MRRIAVNISIILVFAVLGWYCYDTGKAYKVLLENLPYVMENGEQVPGIEALNAVIDQNKPVFMLDGDRTVATAVGKSHSLKIEILDIEDKVVESRVVHFEIRDLGGGMNLNVVRAYHEGRL